MPKYDRSCTKCGAVIETIERMLDTSPIPCTACGGEMVRASWLARPSFHCDRADKPSSAPEPMTLPDGTETIVKTDAEARALEKNFDGLRIHASPKENMADAKRNREASQAKMKKEIKESITTTVVGMQKDGLL